MLALYNARSGLIGLEGVRHYVRQHADGWEGRDAVALSHQVDAGRGANATEVTTRGLPGDRAYALVDQATSKVASAKNPSKWPHLFDFRAAFVIPPRPGMPLPAVRITLPDGRVLTTDQSEINQLLSQALQREVTLETAERG